MAVDFIPNEQQDEALSKIWNWWKNGAHKPFLFAGAAGTGKTTSARRGAEQCEIPLEKISFMAPTGKAARVLAHKTKQPTSTIHSAIYSANRTQVDDLRVALTEEMKDPNANEEAISALESEISELVNSSEGPTFRFKEALLGQGVMLIDEASMIGADVWKDLMKIQVPKIFIFDPFQLPPVKQKWGMEGMQPDVFLTQIMRQAEGSGVAKAAADIREGRPIRPYGDEFQVAPKGVLTVKDYAENFDIVLTGTNDLRKRMNKLLRKYAGYPEEPVVGDKIVALANDKATGISNGEVFTITSINRSGKRVANFDLVDAFGNRFRRIDAYLPVFKDEALSSGAPHHTVSFTYGYCLTVHKSQGSEYERVAVIDSWKGADHEKWLYTAVTRASKTCTLVTSS